MVTKLALVGIGNSALALLRALQLAHDGGLFPSPADVFPASRLAGTALTGIEIVSAHDIDARKIGRPLHEAATSAPNSVTWRQDLRLSPDRFSSVVRQGRVLDGAPPHLRQSGSSRYVIESDPPLSASDIARDFKDSGADVVVLYLPTGSLEAASIYAEAAIESRCAMVVCMPGFIAVSAEWAERFRSARLPVIGDDVKSQLGTTALHEAIFRLLRQRGLSAIHTYQLSLGGNADHLNLSNAERQAFKAQSKEASLRQLAETKDQIGPTANHYLEWTHDCKRSHVFFRAAGSLGHQVQIDVTLQVSDSPNSAAVVLDAVRVAAAARVRGLSGALLEGAEEFMKSPPAHGIGFSLRQVTSEPR
jgi:myo-inositol-1-phosphate synthase